MESGDRWSMLKCAGGVQDKTIVNRIMLRFRPIAPKPMNGNLVSGELMSSNKNLVGTSKRTKRKYVRVCKRNNRKRRILDEGKEEDNDGNNKDSAILQLMPEKSDLKKSTGSEKSWDLDPTVGNNYRFDQDKMVAADYHDTAMMGYLSDQTGRFISSTTGGKATVMMESLVTVESVTETCMDGGEMGNCTDVEKMRNLKMDTCPGFISDGLNRVLWVNQAYINMVGIGLLVYGCWEQQRAETPVRLVVKEGFVFPYGAFSCCVRLQYGGDGKGLKYTKMVPCDVWRMRSGGFAWRLDVKAALSLGL